MSSMLAITQKANELDIVRVLSGKRDFFHRVDHDNEFLLLSFSLKAETLLFDRTSAVNGTPPGQATQGSLPPKTGPEFLLFDDITKQIWDHTE